MEKPKATEEVLIDNDHVLVTRVTIPPGEAHAPMPRSHRVVVAISDSDIRRHKSHEPDAVLHRRKAGDAVYRAGSVHRIFNQSNETHVSIIVELKTPETPQ